MEVIPPDDVGRPSPRVNLGGGVDPEGRWDVTLEGGINELAVEFFETEPGRRNTPGTGAFDDRGGSPPALLITGDPP